MVNIVSRTNRYWLVAAVFALFTSPALAQTHGNALKGVTKFGFFAGGFTNDAISCGISDELTLATFKRGLGSTKIPITYRESTNGFHIRINFDTRQATGGLCVTSLSFKVEADQEVTLIDSGRKVSAKVIVLEWPELIVSPKSAHRDEVFNRVQILAEELASFWQSDNKN